MPPPTQKGTGSNRSQSHSSSREKPRTLQESRDLKYGLHTSRPVRENRKKIDYCKLNDGLEERTTSSPSPKRSRKSLLPSRSGPSNTRMSAQSSPPPKASSKQDKLLGAQTLSGVTPDESASELVGGTDVTPKSMVDQDHPSQQETTITPQNAVTSAEPTTASTQLNDDRLPDLVVNQAHGEKMDTGAADSHTHNTTLTDAATTEDEEDAAEALLRLGDDMNLGPIDDNSTLMPIGGTGEGIATDAVPVPIKLSETDVQEAVRNLDIDTAADNINNTVNDETPTNPTGTPLNNPEVPINNSTPVKNTPHLSTKR